VQLHLGGVVQIAQSRCVQEEAEAARHGREAEIVEYDIQIFVDPVAEASVTIRFSLRSS
jgi:hypothetical protein